MKRSIDYMIFTDGSVRRDGYFEENRKTYAGFGVVLYNMETRKFTTFGGELGSRTIAYAELWAIYRGIAELAAMLPKDVDEPWNVLLLTDSKLSVESLDKYIPGWQRNARDGVWYTGADMPVRNQNVYKRIIASLNRNQHIRVQINHINSHLPYQKNGHIRKKLEPYGINMDEETATAIIRMNAIADSVATRNSRKLQRAENRHDFIRLRPKETYY